MFLSALRLKGLWANMQWYGLFMDNPDAPTEEAFREHYSRADADPGFSWVDHAHGLTYQYDLSINQAQVTPAIEPYAKMIDKVNVRLWEILPPRLIEAPADWSNIWFEAAYKLDVSTMEFILMQGFDVNTRDKNGADALFYAVAPWGGSFNAVYLLVEAGANLDTVDQLIQMGADSVSGPGEANEHYQIASYLRSKAPPRP